MKNLLALFLIFNCSITPIAAQQNWAAIPCFKPQSIESIDKMLVDSLHNELILYSNDGSKVCNTNYKGIFAYNGNGFRDLDIGINTHQPGGSVGGLFVHDCITYGNKTLFGGGFLSVGSNTLYAKSIALWNGTKWDTFPTHCFSNKLNFSGGGFYGFLKHQGKLWMYGGFDTIGTTISKNLVAFDGNTFTPVPPIPVNYNTPILKMIVYKNKLIASGIFYDYPSNSISRLAMFDGTSWATVGVGVRGNIGNIYDMKIYQDTLYIAGTWTKASGNVSNYIMKWDGTQLHDAGFGAFYNWGAIWSLVPYRDRLYAFGNFDHAANQKAFGVAYLEKGKWTVPQDSIENWGIRNAIEYNGSIYIGGAFRSINGDTNINSLAKLLCPDFDASTGCLSGLKDNYINRLNLKVFPNPANNTLNIETDYSIKIERITLTNALGQVVFSALNPENKLTLDISFLPSGIYFLRAENKQGQSVFKVVKE